MTIKDFTGRILPSQHKLYRFALRILGSVQEAEDVVQEVLMNVWSNRQEMTSIKNAEAWCMRMVKNRSLDQLKAKRNQPHKAVEDLHLGETAPAPDQITEINDTMDLVKKVIQSLPDKQRMVIQLREVEGYSYQEIADMMEIDMNQVKVNIFRARKTLRQQMMKMNDFGLGTEVDANIKDLRSC